MKTFARWKEIAEQALLERQPGNHVIFVRYTGGRTPHQAWIYNPADIDAAPVIWALDLGQTENEKLRRYYTGIQGDPSGFSSRMSQ